MDMESEVYKLACEGNPGPQIVEKILRTEIKNIRNIMDKLVREGKLIPSHGYPITRSYKKYTKGKP